MLLTPARALVRPTFARAFHNTSMNAALAYREGQPKTLSFQKSLPRLPVPTLAASLERYVKSLRPILLQRALAAGKDEQSVELEVQQRKIWAADFMKQGGLGATLQERLHGQSRLHSSPLFARLEVSIFLVAKHPFDSKRR